MQFDTCFFIKLYFITSALTSVKTRPVSNTEQNNKLYEISKRNLLSKELEYIKSNPLSKELRSFINRYKRKATFPQKRDKELNQEGMFVVKDGDIVPLKEMQSTVKESNDLFTDEDERFTVIPLIVPITVSRERNSSATCGESELRREESTTFVPVVTRDESLRRHYTTHRIRTQKQTKDETEEEVETTVQTANPKLLNKVFEDMKELITDQKSSKGSEQSICSVNGDWDSVAGGIQIRIVTQQNDTHHPQVYLAERDPPMDEGFFKEGNWSISGLIPYSKYPILILNAHTIKAKKLVAVFIGECKICEEEESITGHWLIERQSKDCSDRQVSHRFVSDVLKKNNVRSLQQQHLNSLVTVPSIPTVL